MSNEDIKVWGIHTLKPNLFLKDEIIAIGWHEIGDLSLLPPDREVFKKKYAETYPERKKGSIPTSSGMLYRFCYEVQIGDYVVFPEKVERQIYIGQVIGEYKYNPDEGEYVNQRKVKWLKHIPRTSFTQGALYEIGSAMSFFTIKNYADEFLAALNKGFEKHKPQEEDESVKATAEDIKESTRDYVIKELSRNLKGYDLENFVADLLKAMGYKADVSPHGGDHGIDIVAYENDFPPRIVVQVKSKDGDVKETEVHALKGLMKDGDYGLFFALSSFTPNAQKFINDTPDIRGFDGPAFVNLILKYYDKLSLKYKEIIPLERVYIPVPKEEL